MISLEWRNIISNCTSYDVNVGLKEFIDSLLTAIRKDLDSEKDQIHQISRNLFAKPVSPYHFWLCNWSGHRHNMTAAVFQSGTPGDPRSPSRRSSSTRNNGTPTGDKENRDEIESWQTFSLSKNPTKHVSIQHVSTQTYSLSKNPLKLLQICLDLPEPGPRLQWLPLSRCTL